MSSLQRYCLLLLLATATFTSCKKAVPKQTKFIPKEAVLVTTIHTKSLQNKLAKNEATLERLFKSMAKGNDTAMNKGKKEWEDFKKSGVDLDENFYLSVVNKGGGSMMPGAGSAITAVIGGLEDATKLVAYVKKKDATLEVKKEKDYSYVTKDDNMIAWGKDVVIAMSYQKQMDPGMMEFDSTTNSFNIKPGQANAAADLVTEMTRYFNLKEDETIGAINEFADLAKSDADASFWINSASNMENLPIPLPKVKELFENSFTAATLNFEEGKMVFNSKSYSSKPMSDLLKKYTGTTADLSLVQNYPSNNINGFAVMSFNPQFFAGLVQYMEVGAMVDGYLTRMMGADYKLQDALKAIKGDFAIIVSDLAVTKNTTAPMGAPAATTPHGKVLVNIPVGDKVEMNRLLDRLSSQQMIVKENNQYTLAPALRSLGFQLSVDDKNLLFTTDSTLLQQYKAKTGKATIDNNVLNDFKNKSAITYIDLQKIMNAFPATDGASSAMLNTAKQTFKDMKGYTENFNGKYIEGRFELRMTKENENSLTSLLNFAAVAAENAEKFPGKRLGRDVPTVVTDTVTAGTE